MLFMPARCSTNCLIIGLACFLILFGVLYISFDILLDISHLILVLLDLRNFSSLSTNSTKLMSFYFSLFGVSANRMSFYFRLHE